jgi:hypothetical protein
MDINYLLVYASSAIGLSAGLMFIVYLLSTPGLWKRAAPQQNIRAGSRRPVRISGHMVRRGKLSFNPIIGCAMPFYVEL